MSGSNTYAFLLKELETQSRMYRARMILIGFFGVLFAGLSWVSIASAASSADVSKPDCPPELSRSLWSRIKTMEEVVLQYRNMTAWLGRVDTLVAIDSVVFDEFDTNYVFPYSETFAPLLTSQKSFRLSLENIVDNGAVRNAYDKLWEELWMRTHDKLIFNTEGISLNHWMQDLYFASHCKRLPPDCRAQQQAVLLPLRDWASAVRARIPEIESAMKDFIDRVRLICPSDQA